MSTEPGPVDHDLDLPTLRALREAILRAAAADAMSATEPPAPDRLLDLIVRTSARAIPSPEGALFLVDPLGKRLTFEVVIGETAEKVKHLSLPLGHGIAGLVAVTGQPIAVANAQQDPRHARDIAEHAGYFPTTILAVPVTTADGTVLGVLELLDRQERATFSLSDMELLGHFAQLTATALELRRTNAVRGALIGEAVVELTGLSPEVRAALTERLEIIAGRVHTDPAARQTREMAEAIATLARSGEAEQRLCLGILDLFGEYVASRPEPGASLSDLW